MEREADGAQSGIGGHTWSVLLKRAREGHLLPFLGAGASAETLPLGQGLSTALAEEYGYPDNDPWNLARVTRFIQFKTDELFAREEVARLLRESPDPDWDRSDLDAHRGAAELSASVYVTTNYDDHMEQAIRAYTPYGQPVTAYAAWNEWLREETQFPDDRDYEPTPEEPLVYHLHGTWRDPKSMVLTEEDQMQWVESLRSGNFLPGPVLRAFSDYSVLFIGYSVRDWSIRSLLDNLQRLRRKRHVAVMGKAPSEELRLWREAELHDRNIEVYWGTARDFASELVARLETEPG